MQSVAITVIGEVAHRFASKSESGTYIRPGSIRYVGQLKETEPVIFLSSQYLMLKATTTRSSFQNGQHPQPLLQCHYGYDVDADREKDQVVRKMAIGSKNEVLHVALLWCLLIGSGEQPDAQSTVTVTR